MTDASGVAYPSTIVTAVTRRYADAYIVARTIVGLGDTIKGVGILIGLVVAIGSLIAAMKGGMGMILGFMGIAIATTIATALYLLGTVASAQGQILKATLDTAVNSSEFLRAQDRAQIMSLPYGAPGTGGALVNLPPEAQAEWRCRCGQVNPAGAAACLDCGVHYGVA